MLKPGKTLACFQTLCGYCSMRYYLENSKKLMPGVLDDEDTDEEEESDWLEEDGLP